MVSRMSELDAELQAIQAVIDALEPLEGEARDRVIHYAFARLGLEYSEGEAPGGRQDPPPGGGGEGGGDGGGSGDAVQPQVIADIRTLRNEKQPGSANEMAAVAGYYLAELAAPGERRTEIGTDDIQTLFKQAGYPLPQRPRQTLPNASAAGYFESVGGGRYRLNPVGHNLVVHSLPRKEKATTRPRRAASKKPSAKKATTRRPAKAKTTKTATKKKTRSDS
jgi:hypothetical protein